MKNNKNGVVICMKVLLFILMVFMMVKANYTKSIWAKGSASMCFVLAGVINLIVNKKKDIKYSAAILLALFFGFIGDVSIMIKFLLGAAFFLVGHIVYFVAYHFILPFHKKQLLDMGITWLVTETLLLSLSMIRHKDTKTMIVCVLYATVISLMVGKAIYNYRMINDKSTLVICVASIAFLISDMFVAISSFKILPTDWIRMTGLCFYYPSQFVLAQSILKEKEMNETSKKVA